MSTDRVSSPEFVAKAKEFQTYYPIASPSGSPRQPSVLPVGGGVSAFEYAPRPFVPGSFDPLAFLESEPSSPPASPLALTPSGSPVAYWSQSPDLVEAPIALPSIEAVSAVVRAPRAERKRKAPADSEPEFPPLDKACGELPDNVIHFEITAIKRLPANHPFGYFVYHMVGTGFNVSSDGEKEAEYDFDVYITELEIKARAGNDDRFAVNPVGSSSALPTGPQGVAGLLDARVEINRAWTRMMDRKPAFQLAAGAVARCVLQFDTDERGSWKKITCADQEYGRLSPSFSYDLELLHWPEARRRLDDGTVLRRSARLSGLPADAPAMPALAVAPAPVDMPALAVAPAPVEAFRDLGADI